MEVPGKETAGVVEGIFGRLGAKMLIGTIVVGAAIGAVGVALSAVKQVYDGAAPYLSPEIPSWAVNIVVAIAGVVLAAYVFRRFGEVDRLRSDLASLREHGSAPTEEEKQKLNAIENRLKVIESERHAASESLTHPQKVRVAQMQAVLREAAAKARQAAEDAVTMDRQSERAVIHVQLLSLIRECFAYPTVADFEAFRRVRDEKMQDRQQHPDGRSHFVEYAEYLESLANRLRLEDIDSTSDLPGSFEQFMKRWK